MAVSKVREGLSPTDLLPGTSESGRNHEPAGGGCQRAELVTQPFESDRDHDHVDRDHDHGDRDHDHGV